MIKFFLMFFLALGIFQSVVFAQEEEYSFKEAKLYNSSVSLQDYFDSLNAPSIHSDRKCSKGKKPVCWPIITNNNKVLKSYGVDDSVSIYAYARYKNIAYIFYSHDYTRGKKSYSDYYIIDNNGKNYEIKYSSNYLGKLLDRTLSKTGELIDVRVHAIAKGNKILVHTSKNLTNAIITNNIDGDLAIAAITESDTIFISNTKKWKNTNLKLTHSGDRKGILSVFPKTSSEIIYSVYKYVNAYNKGLVFGKVNFKTDENFYGWLFNSEKRNIGFDPIIYEKNKTIFVGATNSSNNSPISLELEDNVTLKEIANIIPPYIEGFENEKYVSFIIGTSLSYIMWEAYNEIKDENDNFFGKIQYDINDAIYKSVYFQGKIGKTQLTVSYLKNEAEKVNQTVKKASKYLSTMIDIDDFFSPQSSLRIIVEKANITGFATWKTNDGIIKKDLKGNFVNSAAIETSMQRYSLFVMKERGLYHGLDYTKYRMPSLLGFGKDGNVKFTLFDPEAVIEKVTYNIGYDELSYAHRYETNFSRFYLQGLLGLGIGYITMSDGGKKAKEKAKELGYDKAIPLSIAVDYALDFGYILQKRSKFLWGAGFSTQIGYKLKGTYLFSGSTSENTNDNNSLSLELKRNDIWHGGYITFNLIF